MVLYWCLVGFPQHLSDGARKKKHGGEVAPARLVHPDLVAHIVRLVQHQAGWPALFLLVWPLASRRGQMDELFVFQTQAEFNATPFPPPCAFRG
jgi:hypothetical protein